MAIEEGHRGRRASTGDRAFTVDHGQFLDDFASQSADYSGGPAVAYVKGSTSTLASLL